MTNLYVGKYETVEELEKGYRALTRFVRKRGEDKAKMQERITELEHALYTAHCWMKQGEGKLDMWQGACNVVERNLIKAGLLSDPESEGK